MYDYIIVGAGPCGLLLSYYLSSKYKVLLIEREEVIGGCHRVQRVNGKFSEHGPRIYIDNYLNTIHWLKEMGMNFYDHFVPYKYSIFGKNVLDKLTLCEKMIIGIQYIKFFFNEKMFEKTTVYDFVNKYNFTSEAKDAIDRICRMSDGGTIREYTMYEFLQVVNSNMLYDIYQPNLPLDINFFPFIQRTLENRGVKILLNTTVESIQNNRVIVKGNEYKFNKLILAIPPINAAKIIRNNLKLLDFALKTNYITYLCCTYTFPQKIIIPDLKQGLTYSDWGVAFIMLSDYMNIDYTLISATATMLNVKSKYTGKTANESNEDEVKKEIWRQANEVINMTGNPVMTMSPNNYREISDNNIEWKSKDNAFFLTKYGYMDFEIDKNIYSVGTQNGYSEYSFTSMEAAVTNSMYFLNKYENMNIKIQEYWTVKKIFMIIFVIIFLLWCVYMAKN